MAAGLRKESGLNVELIDGDPGEFTVSVDGRVVAQKGETMPSASEVLSAVKKTASGAAV